MSRRILSALLLAAAALGLAGCEGRTSRMPPIQVWPDMKHQPKFLPQQENPFFSDLRADRMPVADTVARGALWEDDALHTGISGDQFIGRNPLPVDRKLLELGRVKFNTYCAPCHDQTGSGQGTVPKRATWLPTNLHEARVVAMNDGEIFNIISHGRRSMPPYHNQIAAEDRWAVVAYVRALQRTITTMEDVPENDRAQVR
jgi:hypothetical protein